MDKPKPDIIQVKAPSKWDILKEKSKHIKQYLKGRFIEGGQYISRDLLGEVTASITKFDDGETLQKHRKRRKKLKKISYASRRKNRSGL